MYVRVFSPARGHKYGRHAYSEAGGGGDDDDDDDGGGGGERGYAMWMSGGGGASRAGVTGVFSDDYYLDEGK